MLYTLLKQILKFFQNTINRISRNPVMNLLFLILSLLAGLNLLWTSFFHVKIDSSLFLQQIDRYFLYLFAIEFVIRLLGSDSYYRKIYPYVDLLVLLPILGFIFPDLIPDVHEPGALLVRSFRFLKFLFYYRLFSSTRVKGSILIPEHSPIKIRMFTGTAVFIFMVVIGSGSIFATLHEKAVSLEKATRVSRISDYIQTHSPGETNRVFSRSILKIKKESFDETFEISNVSPDTVKDYYLYDMDYIQIDHVVPGVSIQISFLDLNQRQNLLEMSIILLGLLVTGGLVFSLNHHLEKYVLRPVDRARRVIGLRVSGEDMQASFDSRQVPTEITDLILEFDRMYQKLTARKGTYPRPSNRT